MAVGHSDDVDPGDAIAAVIAECREGLGGSRPQAGILFSTFDSFSPSLVGAVLDAFPGVQLMGSTSGAEISSAAGYMEDSISLALFASEEIDITTGIGAGLVADVEAACHAAVEQALSGTTREPRLCIMITEANVIDPQLTLDALKAALPEGVVVLGGTAARSDFVTMTPTFQFRNDTMAEDGVAIMLFSGPVAFSTAVGMGWRTVGPQGVVTRSDFGAIYEIDGQPALDFVSRYLDVSGLATFANPLAVLEDGAEEYYLRATTAGDAETGTLRVAGSVPVGARVQLTTAGSDEILAGTRDALVRATDAFPAGATPEAALIFSCAIRKFILGTRTRAEADFAKEVLGEIPVAGTYCYGEVGPVMGAGGSRLLNETFVTVLLGS